MQSPELNTDEVQILLMDLTNTESIHDVDWKKYLKVTRDMRQKLLYDGKTFEELWDSELSYFQHLPLVILIKIM